MSIDIQLFYLPLHTNYPLILNKQMKLRNVSAGIVLCLTMVSCIQDEALNVEAAIDGCSGTNIQLSTIHPSSKTDYTATYCINSVKRRRPIVITTTGRFISLR